MKTMSGWPDSVSMLNMTPLDARSLRTICITATDRNTLKWSKPLSMRYEIARSVNSDAWQRFTASSSTSSPWMLR